MLFLICNIIGQGSISKKDAEIICAHAAGKGYWPIESLITYCVSFGWVQISDGMLRISPEIYSDLNDKDKLNRALIISTVGQLFNMKIINSNMFFYDAVQGQYVFKNELLPLSFSCVRNVLISQGFLIPQRKKTGTQFYVEPTYDELISEYCKKQRKTLTLEALRKKLEHNEIIGEKAELFALEFEQKRIGFPLCERVKRISEIDVAAGYKMYPIDWTD